MSNKKTVTVPYALQFNVAQLLKEATGGTRQYDVNADIEHEFDEDVIAVSPLSGRLNFLRTGSHIFVTGSLEVTLQKGCARCLTDLVLPVSIEIEELFYSKTDIVTGHPVPIPEDVDEANLIDDHNIVDLSEIVRQELVLANDVVIYCRPDCRGLCPYCGIDLNVDTCDCEANHGDPRWSGLQGLQIDEER
jgi:uncharacterized protein